MIITFTVNFGYNFGSSVMAVRLPRKWRTSWWSNCIAPLIQMPRTVATTLWFFSAVCVGTQSTPLLAIELLSNAGFRLNHITLVEFVWRCCLGSRSGGVRSWSCSIVDETWRAIATLYTTALAATGFFCEIKSSEVIGFVWEFVWNNLLHTDQRPLLFLKQKTISLPASMVKLMSPRPSSSSLSYSSYRWWDLRRSTSLTGMPRSMVAPPGAVVMIAELTTCCDTIISGIWFVFDGWMLTFDTVSEIELDSGNGDVAAVR